MSFKILLNMNFKLSPKNYNHTSSSEKLPTNYLCNCEHGIEDAHTNTSTLRRIQNSSFLTSIQEIQKTKTKDPQHLDTA